MNTLNAKFIAVFCFLLIAAFSVSESWAQYFLWAGDKPTITVSGEADVKVTPDKAIIILEVATLDSVLLESKAENDKKVSKFNAIAQNFDVDPADIQVDHFSFEATYYKPHSENIFIGYKVKRIMVITLSEISKFDDLMTNLLSEGADKLLNVQFRTSELRKYRDKARALAIKAAKDKAHDLASELNQTIGKPFNIKENRSSSWSWYGWSGYGRGGYASQNIQSIEPTITGSGPIALGKISVIASVNVTFELE